jgi:hypothetical protein
LLKGGLRREDGVANWIRREEHVAEQKADQSEDSHDDEAGECPAHKLAAISSDHCLERPPGFI